MQQVLARYNLDRPDVEQILLSVGLEHGLPLHIGDTGVFGAEVNAGCKLLVFVVKYGERRTEETLTSWSP